MRTTCEVKVISEQGEAALVEWFDTELRRAVIPKALIMEGTADVADGTPYGEDWAAHSGLPKKQAHELAVLWHNAGIWTRDDMIRQWNAAQAYLTQVLLGPVIVNIMKKVNENG